VQCKDIPDAPILRFLSGQSAWAGWHDLPRTGEYCPTVRDAMPEVPDKLVLAKMRTLIRRGLVSGCGCGCRGDFRISPKGLEYLHSAPTYIEKAGKH